MKVQVENQDQLFEIGIQIGSLLTGGEIIELVGDVGAGKTTFTKAIARGMGIPDTISSPSYTLSQTYEAPSGLRMVHYDFYRLDDPGILANELAETINDNQSVSVIEWGDIVSGILPSDHLRVHIVPLTDTARQLTLTAGGSKSTTLLEGLQ